MREPDEPQEWCVLETYQSRGALLMVDAKLAHRARWLLKLGTVSEAELEYLATGKLQNPPDDAP